MPMHKLLKEIKLYMKINYFKKKKNISYSNFYLKKNTITIVFFNFYYWLNFDKLLGAF